MNNHRAMNTIVRQSLAVILSLAAGSGIIILFAFVGNSFDLHYPDGSQYTFGGTFGLCGGMAVIAALFWVLPAQFEEALDFESVISSTLRATLISGGFLTALFAVVTLLLGDVFLFLVYIASCTMLLFMLGVSTGLILAVILRVEEDNPDKHLQRITNEADVEACKLGILPYRQRVSMFWQIAGFGLGAAIIGGMLVFIYDEIKNDVLAIGFFSALLFLFALTALIKLINLLSPSIGSITGVVTKSMTRGYKSQKFYHLHCGGRSFNTDISIWYTTVSNRRYRLWYLRIGRGGRVIAYEPITAFKVLTKIE